MLISPTRVRVGDTIGTGFGTVVVRSVRRTPTGVEFNGVEWVADSAVVELVDR